MPADLAMYRRENSQGVARRATRTSDEAQPAHSGSADVAPACSLALARVRVTVAYAVIRDRRHQRSGGARVLRCRTASSATPAPTLHNLSHGHLGTLLGSAFVVDAGPDLRVAARAGVPDGACRVDVAQPSSGGGLRRRPYRRDPAGRRRADRGRRARLAADVDVSRATDVGMSYGAAAVLGALTAAIPRRWRPAWIGWWLAVGRGGGGRRQGLHRCRACGGAGARHAGRRRGSVSRERGRRRGVCCSASRRLSASWCWPTPPTCRRDGRWVLSVPRSPRLWSGGDPLVGAASRSAAAERTATPARNAARS